MKCKWDEKEKNNRYTGTWKRIYVSNMIHENASTKYENGMNVDVNNE